MFFWILEVKNSAIYGLSKHLSPSSTPQHSLHGPNHQQPPPPTPHPFSPLPDPDPHPHPHPFNMNNLSSPVQILAPFSFLNPTTRYHPITPTRLVPEEKGESSSDQHQDTAQQHPPPLPPQDHGIYHIWRSRDNRKGRHAALVPRPTPGADEKAAATVPRATNSVAETLKGLVKMVTRYPIWDVSYDVAVVFTLGTSSFPWCALFGGAPIRDVGTSLILNKPLTPRRLRYMGHQRLLRVAPPGCSLHRVPRGSRRWRRLDCLYRRHHLRVWIRAADAGSRQREA